ncbi:hypothetical protein Tco_1415870 [Tanacetum coccineum]
MVSRSASLRYETGEKEVNKVDFISQGMELVSRMDCRVMVKEIEDGLVEEMEKLEWWFEQDIYEEGDEDKEDENGGEV